ncbi:MAG TPA: DJ-1/PfpI family protein [Phycisphaerales bacterium]|jgi:4-methyl-5(b-hydroxyethyl)-thiazole monophosphate biosynthesis|nr:DJ-1/PfpI family protein [Phycisphaerales bacterium]
MAKTALVVIADGTEEIEAITPADVLTRAGVDVTVAGLGTIEPMGVHNLPLRAQMLVEDLGEILFDCLILPGGGKGAENMHKSAWVNDAILRHWKNDRIVAAICASPAVVLLPTGILANKHATCFPGLERRFTQDVKAVDSDVCVDGKLVTSKGPGTAMAFSLRLVELLCGLSKAIDVGRRMVVPRM